LWVIGIALVYFLVDVEDVKKFAVTTVNENTTGELSLGEIKLKVFPLVHFEIKDLAFKSSPNFDKKEMFGCKSAKLTFNLFTLVLGKPRISLHLDNPSLNFVSDGKTNNISDAFKTEKKKKSTDVLTYLFISKFIFNVDEADLRYKTPKDLYEIKGLNMDLAIDPVSTSIDLVINTPIDYKKLDTIIKGDLNITADVKFVSKDKSDIKASIDATKLLISTKAIEKKKGDALKITLMGGTDLKDNVSIKDFTVVLLDEFLRANGNIEGFASGSPKINLDMTLSNKFKISNFGKLLKSMKDYDVSGKLDGNIKIAGLMPKEGTNNKIRTNINVDATNTSIKSSVLNKEEKMPLKLTNVIQTDFKSLDIEQLQVSFKDLKDKALLVLAANGSIKDMSSDKPIYDVKLETLNISLEYFAKQIKALSKYNVSGDLVASGSILGSMSPLPIVGVKAQYKDARTKNNVVINISNTEKSRSLIVADISSQSIDLNPYLPPVDKTKKAKAGKTAETGDTTGAATEAEKPASKPDEDMVVLKKENVEAIKKALDKYSIKLNARIGKLTSRELVINNFIMDGLFTKNEAAINRVNLSLLKGDISGALKVGLDLDSPTYKGNLDLKGIKVKDAADIFMPSIKGVVDGTVSSGLEFTASGYSMKPIKQSMVAKGNFALNNFAYSALELNTLINEKLKDKLGSFGVSGDKKILGSNPGWETVQGTYNIKDGKINVEQLFAKEGEYEATGKGEVTFTEYMDMYMDLTVPYRNLPYEAIKVEGKDRSKIPVHVLGPILKPRFDGGYLIKYVAERAIEYETKKLKDAALKEVERLKQETKTKVEAEAKKAAAPVQQKANEEIKKAGEDLKKAFKGFKF
jgi:hypothetical protein